MRTSGPALCVTGVHKSYRRRHVLKGVSFELPPGQLAGIVGENGAGKSTLLRILVGDLALDAGTVQCRGVLGYCPQQSVLHEAFTLEQHLEFFRTAYGLHSLHRAHEVLEILHCTEYLKARTGTLSGGTRQKLNLTLALMHDPQVLLLDEPYQGFDWETYLRFWDLAQDLRDRGCSVLVVSHLTYDASRLDCLYRLHDGVLEKTERIGVATGHAATSTAGTEGVRS
ncbi:ABC transporter ATP-binding protein [Streptomyces pseudoechinosporeus]